MATKTPQQDKGLCFNEGRRVTPPHTHTPTDLDDLAALHLHQLAKVLLQEAGVGAPLEEAKEVHWEETTAASVTGSVKIFLNLER